MGLFDYLRYTAQANQQPDLGALIRSPAAPSANQPAPFMPSSLPWQDQLAGAIDYGNSSGDAWNAIGRDGVIDYMGSDLQNKYGTRNLSDFRYIEDASVPGGYRLDWAGRQPATGLVGGLRDAARSFGVTMDAGTGSGGDGLGGGLTPQNPSEALPFGVTWEGEGGTGFNLYRKPDGSVGVKTGSQSSNETGDVIAALAILGGGYMAGTGAFGGAAGGAGAAEGAVGSGAGFVGEGALSGVGAWDAALAGAPSWTAAGGMAGGAAGVTDLGGGLSMGADGAITGATGLNPSTLSNAGLMESFGAGGGGVGGLGGAGGSGGGTPGTFNAAMDSQAANSAIEAAGGDALSGYTAAGIPSVTVNGAAGTSLFDTLAGKVGSMGVSDWLGAGSTVLGALGGAQGQGGSSTSSRAMDPRMDSLFYGDLAPRTQGLLGANLPAAQNAGNQMLSKGSGLLGQTAPNTATNPYATGILDDLQRRQQEMISRGLQQTKGNFVGTGGLGGSRQGIAEADAITRGADNFTGQAANFMGGLYNADQNRLRQDWTIGSGLMNQGVNTPFMPAQNAAQIYSPFTGFGTTTNDAKTGGGWQGAVGGALAGASFGRNMGWW